MSGRTLVPFTIQDDLGGAGSYGLAATDQRHRAVFNGIWEVGHGFQVSGLHYLGAGIRSATSYGGDVRADGRHLQRAPASGRHARSAQRVHPAGAESNRHPRAAEDSAAAAACRLTASPRSSTCSIGRTTRSTRWKAARRICIPVVGTEPHRAGRLPIDVLRKLKVQSAKVESKWKVAPAFHLLFDFAL